MSSNPSEHQAQGPAWGTPEPPTPGPAGAVPPSPSGSAPGGYPPAGQPWPGGWPEVSEDDRTMAMLAHLATIAALILSAGWLSFVGPLIVWIIYKDRSPFVRASAAGAFNFNVGIAIFMIVGWIFTLTIIGAIIGLPMLLVGAVLQVVFHILGAVSARRGELYRYPMQLRILS